MFSLDIPLLTNEHEQSQLYDRLEELCMCEHRTFALNTGFCKKKKKKKIGIELFFLF